MDHILRPGVGLPFITLWTHGGKQCVVFVDSTNGRYDLRFTENQTVLLEQLNVLLDEVMPMSLDWERQFAADAH